MRAVPIRVHAHVEAEERPKQDQRWWGPSERALLVHVLTNDQDELVLATSRELMLTLTGDRPSYVTTEERLFYPEAMTAAELEELRGWARVQRPASLVLHVTGDKLSVETVEVLGRLVVSRSYRHRKKGRPVPVVGFDLPYVLGRLAAYASGARSSASKRADGLPFHSGSGGFSLALVGCGAFNDEGEWKDSQFYPRLKVVAREGNLGAFFEWLDPYDPESRYDGRKSRFVDLGVLSCALSGTDELGPQVACERFGIDWPSRATTPAELLRGQATALVELYNALVQALVVVAPGLAVDKAFSSGSVAQGSLRLAKVKPPATKAGSVPLAHKGAMSSAFLGGRIEALLVGVPVPMGHIDISSTYPSAFSLLGLTPVYSCDHFGVEELSLACVAHALVGRGWRQGRDWWRRYGLAFVTVRPHGEPLPASCEWWRPDKGTQSHSPLDLGGGALTWHICDLAAAVEEGAEPEGFEVVRAWRLVPTGVQAGLRHLRLPTGRLVDLTREDLGAALVEERAAAKASNRHWLAGLVKLYGNSLTYGVLARSDRKASGREVPQVVYGPEGEAVTIKGRTHEEPGPFAFVPVAAAVCAGARLLVAMAMSSVAGLGGAVAHVLTDSLLVPASPEGGYIACPGAPEGKLRLLTLDELASVMASFEALGITWRFEEGTGSGLTLGLVTGPNNYVLMAPDGKVVRATDANMQLADPTGTGARTDGRRAWVADLEGRVLAYALANEVYPGSDLLLPPDLPDYTKRLSVRAYSARNWPDLRSLRRQTGKQDVGPFAHYLTASTPRGKTSAVALGKAGDPKTWRQRPWYGNGSQVGLFAPDEHGGLLLAGNNNLPLVRASTVGEQLDEWANRLADNPALDGPRRGLRHHARVYSSPGLIGFAVGHKDYLADGVRQTTSGITPSGVEALRGTARLLSQRELALRSGVPQRTLGDWLAGGKTSRRVLVKVASALGEKDVPRACAVEGCDQPARSRSRTCSDACKQRLRRGTSIAPVAKLCAVDGCDRLARPKSNTCSPAHKTKLARGREQ